MGVYDTTLHTLRTYCSLHTSVFSLYIYVHKYIPSFSIVTGSTVHWVSRCALLCSFLAMNWVYPRHLSSLYSSCLRAPCSLPLGSHNASSGLNDEQDLGKKGL